MENVLDEDWRLLLDVYRIVDHPKFKLCLDMGHAYCYSKVPVLKWAKELAPYVDMSISMTMQGTGIPIWA